MASSPAMDFFGQQERVRTSTRRLVFLFITVIGPAAAAQEMLYAQAEAALRQGAALRSAGPDLRFLPLTECNPAQIDHALVRIAQAATP